MKNILLISSLLISVSAFAGFKTAQEAETKLKTFSSKSFETKDQKAIIAMEDDLVDSLSDAVELSAPMTDSLKKEIVRVAIVLLKQDKTNYGAEIILPLYKKNETEFKAIFKTLPKPDSRLLEESIQGAKDEASGAAGDDVPNP